MSAAAPGAAAGAFVNAAVGEVRFGIGCVAELGPVLARDGIERAVIVTGRSLAASGTMERLLAATNGRCVAVHAETTPHVPRQSALALANVLRAERADAVISFGGSTPSDSAKAAIWALADNLTMPDQFGPCAIRFDDSSRRIVPALRGRALPLYAVPTTLSAGEFTSIAGVTDTELGEKHLHQDPKLGARVVFLDPALTLETPEWLWLSSGVKAVDHCLEAWFSLRAQPITDALAAEALAALLRFLPRTRRSPGDLEARLQSQLAAWLSVFGLANVSLGLSHGLGHQLGARCGMAHGYTSCVVMHHVVGFNAAVTAERRQMLCARLETMLGRTIAADGLQQALLRFVRDELDLPWRLRDLNVAPEALPDVAEASLRDPIVATNPRRVGSSEEILQLLKAAW